MSRSGRRERRRLLRWVQVLAGPACANRSYLPAATAFSASPNDQTDAPSSTASFRMNWPGATERAGKPPREGSQPGVENRKVSVTTKVAIAIRLPATQAIADQGRTAISTPAAISATPIRFEVACTLKA